MNGYLELAAERRRVVCEQAQAVLNLPAASLEKDYWVCWTLRELFGIPEWGRSLTFKGGTSLSKCWGLIDRFSEDIDIVIDKDFLGFGGDASPENAPSKKQVRRRLETMKEATQQRIHSELLPVLRTRIDATLSRSDEWNLEAASEDVLRIVGEFERRFNAS